MQTPESLPSPSSTITGAAPGGCAHRHLRFGWWALLCFLSLGLALEALHGFKAGFYLDVSNQTRRLMWTLAHAHGTLLALVNIAFAATVQLLPLPVSRVRHFISCSLIGASVLIPAGFFGGGLFIHAGDPGLCILLVPLGAVMFLAAVFLTARATGNKKSPPPTAKVAKSQPVNPAVKGK